MKLTTRIWRNLWPLCITLWALVLLGATVVLLLKSPEWLVGKNASGGVAIRNLVLAIAALVALPAAIWRSIVPEQQENTAFRQSLTAQAGLQNTRYHNGASMLGDDKSETVRLAGVHELRRLTEEYPDEYHLQSMGLLCAFVRSSTADPPNKLFEMVTIQPSQHVLAIDVEAAQQAIALRSKRGISLEKEKQAYIDLRGANLRNLFWGGLPEASLHKANLAFADLSGARFRGGTDLTRTFCVRTKFVRADLSGADLSVD